MHVIGKGKSNVLPISVILADLEINLGEFSGLEPPKLDYLCFRIYLPSEPPKGLAIMQAM